MIVARSLVSRATPLITKNLISNQRRAVTSGPPSVRVSFVEKLVLMSFISGSIFAIPIYVLCNVKNYRDRNN